MNHRTAVWVLFLGLVALFAWGDSPAWAQRRPVVPAQRPPVKIAEWNLSGTIQEIGPGVIRVQQAEGGRMWLVRVPNNVRAMVMGKASPNYLAIGQHLSCFVTIDKRTGHSQEKVDKLLLFTPNERKQVGVLPDQGIGGFGKSPDGLASSPKGKKDDLAGLTLDADASDEKPSTGKKSSGSRKTDAPMPQRFEFNGRIIKMKGNRITLQAPNNYTRPTVQIELADQPDIDVELLDPRLLQLARRGDSVTIVGRQINETSGLAAVVELTLTEPIGGAAGGIGGTGEAQPKRHSATTKKTDSRGKKTAEADEPATDDASAQPADDAGSDEPGAKKSTSSKSKLKSKAKTKSKTPARPADAMPGDDE